MTRVLVLGAGGPAAIGFCRALRKAGGYRLIGADLDPDRLEMAEVDERIRGTAHVIGDLVTKTRPDFVHAQPDQEVAALAGFTFTLEMAGVKTYLPSYQAIQVCQDKWRSYRIWEDARLPVPRTFLLRRPQDAVKRASALGSEVFYRPSTGSGGSGSLVTASPFAAADWIERRNGWGRYIASEYLPGPTVTWQSLWYKGELIFAQGRSRLAWTNGDRGSALVSETISDETVDAVSEAAIRAIDPEPHGLWGVDMTRDAEGEPRLTEINIGRFFTTVPEFFAEAGCDIAALYVEIGMHGIQPWHGAVRNPLEPGLKWIRSMDREPVLR